MDSDYAVLGKTTLREIRMGKTGFRQRGSLWTLSPPPNTHTHTHTHNHLKYTFWTVFGLSEAANFRGS